VVGRIVYRKNEETQMRKGKGKKTIPFAWEDPSAFYAADKPYVTRKSLDEAMAANGRDLGWLLNRESIPSAQVIVANPNHRGWQLVIPCTTGKDKKTYDHRQLELADLSSDTLRALVPPVPLPWRQQEIDGWASPRAAGPANGATAFVQSAVRLLTHTDWAVLASAAYRPMHGSPAAFDLLSGLLWALRGRKVPGLPSRHVAWLVLKLMSVVPSHLRVLRRHATFCPLDVLPKRQLDKRRGERSPYPVSLPRGQRLEAGLRGAIDQHLRQRAPTPIDWSSLCYRLDRLLDR
jgi:hypothetical protein